VFPKNNTKLYFYNSLVQKYFATLFSITIFAPLNFEAKAGKYSISESQIFKEIQIKK